MEVACRMGRKWTGNGERKFAGGGVLCVYVCVCVCVLYVGSCTSVCVCVVLCVLHVMFVFGGDTWPVLDNVQHAFGSPDHVSCDLVHRVVGYNEQLCHLHHNLG